MAGEVVIRPFRDSDLPEVLDVMRAALGEPPGLDRTPELFAWKHFDNPFGRSLILVAEAEGRIAGLRAFMRWSLVGPDGAEFRCVRAVDTATHPDFQRRGIFRSLTTAAIEAATAEGVDLIFNTPNPESGAGYLTMGWQAVGPIGVMARPGRGLLGIGPRRWAEPGDAGAGKLIAGGGLDGLAGSHAGGLHTPRTRDYLRWRFAAHPTAVYVAAGNGNGAAIGRLNHRQGRRELVLSEIGGRGGAAAARSLIRRFRPDYTAAWFAPGTPERRAAVRAGLIVVPRLIALSLVARPLRSLAVDVTDLGSWDLALGDLELL